MQLSTWALPLRSLSLRLRSRIQILCGSWTALRVGAMLLNRAAPRWRLLSPCNLHCSCSHSCPYLPPCLGPRPAAPFPSFRRLPLPSPCVTYLQCGTTQSLTLWPPVLKGTPTSIPSPHWLMGTTASMPRLLLQNCSLFSLRMEAGGIRAELTLEAVHRLGPF